MSLVTEQHHFAQDVARLLQYAAQQGFVVTLGEAWRTPEQQAEYVRGGRSKTLASNHLRRLAVDLNFFIDGKLVYDKTAIRPLGQYWESLHPRNRWGGNFTSIIDVPHFERNAAA